MKILFLAFEFPPSAAGGVFRAAKVTKYLARAGHEVDVVTVRAEDYATWSSAGRDDSLLHDLPDGVRVHRVPAGFPAWYWRLRRSRLGARVADFVHWGDPVSIFWWPALRDVLDRLVAKRRPDVLLATTPPFGVAVLARRVARRYRLPWVVDWRDPWTLWRMVPFPSYAHYVYTRTAEGRCLREANVSVCTSHVTREDWLGEFGGVDEERLVTIYNGWDADDIAAVAPEAPPAGKRRIAYVGSFYYDPVAWDAIMRPLWRRAPHRWLHYRKRREDWRYRSPYYFLRGLRRFADRRPDLAERLDVTFAGIVPPWLPAMLAETGTASLVALRGRVPHREALALQAGADALLLTSAKIEGRPDYSIAGKTFEYLGLGRPVLAVVTAGAMRDLVTWSESGLVADPDDTDAVADAIERVATGNLPSGRSERAQAFVDSVRRERTVAEMEGALERAAAEGYRG
jgi:glycosyltransferase involved in cell wall biosynthesis